MAMVPVIVGKEDADKVATLVQGLRYAPQAGSIARQLGRYTVGCDARFERWCWRSM